MLRRLIIRKFLAATLLLLFGFSILPKKTVHDLFANHKDRSVNNGTSDKKQVGNAGFSCKFDNLVVESPFVSDIADIQLAVPGIELFNVSVSLTAPLSSQHYFSALRGPPVFIQAI